MSILIKLIVKALTIMYIKTGRTDKNVELIGFNYVVPWSLQSLCKLFFNIGANEHNKDVIYLSIGHEFLRQFLFKISLRLQRNDLWAKPNLTISRSFIFLLVPYPKLLHVLIQWLKF
jgi:hypothetical protein